jgi:hypothetical protein
LAPSSPPFAKRRTTTRDASTSSTIPSFNATTEVPESRATSRSTPVPTSGALRSQQRNGLTLHVRTHQSSVGIIMLQEMESRSRNRHQAATRNTSIKETLSLSTISYSPSLRRTLLSAVLVDSLFLTRRLSNMMTSFFKS